MGRAARSWSPPLLVVILMLALMTALSQCVPAHRIATFNIENYPKHDRQGEAALDLIDKMGVDIVALQEITRPDQFTEQVREELGANWSFVWAQVGGRQRLGFLYNERRFRLERTEIHRETLLHSGAKPAFEAVFRPIYGGNPVHLITVHLKAGSDSHPMRKQQIEALTPLLDTRAAEGARLILLGDFNTTSDADRELLSDLAQRLSLSWASQTLPCTSYWARRSSCNGYSLDHVLTFRSPVRIAADGACNNIGCRPGQSCPRYCREISDHCPVVFDLSAWSISGWFSSTP